MSADAVVDRGVWLLFAFSFRPLAVGQLLGYTSLLTQLASTFPKCIIHEHCNVLGKVIFELFYHRLKGFPGVSLFLMLLWRLELHES